VPNSRFGIWTKKVNDSVSDVYPRFEAARYYDHGSKDNGWEILPLQFFSVRIEIRFMSCVNHRDVFVLQESWIQFLFLQMIILYGGLSALNSPFRQMDNRSCGGYLSGFHLHVLTAALTLLSTWVISGKKVRRACNYLVEAAMDPISNLVFHFIHFYSIMSAFGISTSPSLKQ
jgi:hypothetical protein